MNIYVKTIKNTKGVTKETLWIRFTYNGKLHRKSLQLDNTKANLKLAKTQILPMMQMKLLNGEFFKNKVPTLNEYYEKSFELHKAEERQLQKIIYVNFINISCQFLVQRDLMK